MRSAGAAAQLLAKEGDYAQIRMPSGEVRLVRQTCYATIGQVGNLDHSNVKLGKAGRKRHMGIRPTVRGRRCPRATIRTAAARVGSRSVCRAEDAPGVGQPSVTRPGGIRRRINILSAAAADRPLTDLMEQL